MIGIEHKLQSTSTVVTLLRLFVNDWLGVTFCRLLHSWLSCFLPVAGNEAARYVVRRADSVVSRTATVPSFYIFNCFSCANVSHNFIYHVFSCACDVVKAVGICYTIVALCVTKIFFAVIVLFFSAAGSASRRFDILMLIVDGSRSLALVAFDVTPRRLPVVALLGRASGSFLSLHAVSQTTLVLFCKTTLCGA